MCTVHYSEVQYNCTYICKLYINIIANARPDGGFKLPKGVEAYFTLDNNVGGGSGVST